MIGATFTIWMHRNAASIFGAALRPVNRDGIILAFDTESAAHAECSRLTTGSGDPHTRYSVESKLTDFARTSVQAYPVAASQSDFSAFGSVPQSLLFSRLRRARESINSLYAF